MGIRRFCTAIFEDAPKQVALGRRERGAHDYLRRKYAHMQKSSEEHIEDIYEQSTRAEVAQIRGVLPGKMGAS